MAPNTPPRVILLTPAGRGAIASLLVTGIGAVEVVKRFFRPAAGKAREDFPVGRILYGRWQGEQDSEGEELVVCRRTVEQFEIHCHGGKAAAAALTGCLKRAGCRVESWQDWLQTSYPDTIATEARVALAQARTERAAAILMDQYRGELRRAIDTAVELIQSSELEAAAGQLRQLQQYAGVGLHLSQPWRIVFTGRTNVGKSSLINTLIGYRRAIVQDAPGTTRDVVTATTALDGWPVELADTAGLDHEGGPIERQAAARALDRLQTADLIVLVSDVSRPWTKQDAALLRETRASLLVHNQADRQQSHDTDRPAGVLTSTLTGQGIEPLITALTEKLVPNPPPPGAAVLFTQRQVDAVQGALAALLRGETQQAIKGLTLFENSTEEREIKRGE